MKNSTMITDVDEVLELDDVVDADDFQDIDDVSEVEASTAKRSGGNQKFWMIFAVLAFLLALISSLLISPMVASQKQRLDQAGQIVKTLNLTNSAAAQAMTPTGAFNSVEASLAEAQVTVDEMVSSNSVSVSLANAVFGNSEYNDGLSSAWNSYKGVLDSYLANKNKILASKRKINGLNNLVSSAMTESIAFSEAVAKEGRAKTTGETKDKYLFLTAEASNLNGILARLSGTISRYYDQNTNVTALSDSQGGLMVVLTDTLNRILGNASEVVTAAADPVQGSYSALSASISEISDGASVLVSAKEQLKQMNVQSENVAQAATEAQNQTNLVSLLSGIGNYIPIILALIGAYALWRYSKFQSSGVAANEMLLEETLAEQQESILKLLDEMSALADGDLTVEAEVTDQITGAIADSVNYAVIEMRDLVSQINRASLEVASESASAVNNAQDVSQSNAQQAKEITVAAQMMQKVSSSMREMSEQASSSSAMATESIQAASQGAEAVRDTIKGMEDMREQIQDTSKRIKRLGESSQRIGDIVALIDDIAEQTNILSLNAAIQASMAGEAGRGFAVVSDEVQSLAERSTEATKKIAALVTTIQNDTNDAVLSMEKATQQVVAGTKVADSAGGALAEIENVSKRLSGLIEDISTESNQQAEVVTNVAQKVTSVSDSSSKTSQKSQESANSIAKLLELAKELESSVTRFKLPAS